MYKKCKFLVRFIVYISFFTELGYSAEDLQGKFEDYIKGLEKSCNCNIGVSAYQVSTGKVLEYKAEEKFQMASVVKLPLLTYLAHLEDQRKIDFSEEISVSNNNLSPGSGSLYFYTYWDPVKTTLKNLMESMIVISDNTATDLLFSKIGGPSKVNEYMKKIDLPDIRVDRDIYQLFLDANGIKNSSKFKNQNLEKYNKAKSKIPLSQQKEYHERFHQDLKDRSTPQAMTYLLKKIVNGEILSLKNSNLVLDVLSRCTSSERKMRYFIPKSFTISDKTGSWFYTANQKYTYANNVGVIQFPGSGDKIIISIFINSDNYAKVKKLNEMIAIVSKTIFDIFYFN